MSKRKAKEKDTRGKLPASQTVKLKIRIGLSLVNNQNILSGGQTNNRIFLTLAVRSAFSGVSRRGSNLRIWRGRISFFIVGEPQVGKATPLRSMMGIYFI